MEYPDGSVPQVHAAPHVDTWLQEKLLSLQAFGVNCTACRVRQQGALEASLGPDDCPDQQHPLPHPDAA